METLGKRRLLQVGCLSRKFISKFVISDTLDAAVNAKSATNFKVRILCEIESPTERDLINPKTVSTTQIKEYVGRSGLWLNTPDMSAHTRECLPTEILFISSWNVKVYDLWVLITLQPEPESNSAARESNINVILHLMGSTVVQYIEVIKTISCLSIYLFFLMKRFRAHKNMSHVRSLCTSEKLLPLLFSVSLFLFC